MGSSRTRISVAVCAAALCLGACSGGASDTSKQADQKRVPSAGSVPSAPSHDKPTVEAELPSTSELRVLSIPVGRKRGVQYEDVGVQHARAEGPSAVRRAEDGSVWVADTVGNRLLRFSSAGALDQTFKLVQGQLAASDVWGDGQGVTTLDLSATEPAFVRYSSDGKVMFRVPLPSQYAQAVSGFWDGGDTLPWLDLGDKGVLAVASGTVPTFANAPVPHARAGTGASIEVTSSSASKTLRVTTQDGSFEPVLPVNFTGARLVHVDAKYVFVEAQASDAQAGIARYLMRVRVSERRMQCARIDGGVPFVTIGHDLSIARDGEAYVARPYAQRVDLVRLGWSSRCD